MQQTIKVNVTYLQRLLKKQVLCILGADGELETCILVDDFKGKSRDFYMNEVSGRDVTSIVTKPDLSVYSLGSVERFVEESDLVSLAFGHDNFVIYKNVLKPHEITG